MPLNHQSGYKELKNNAKDISRQSCNGSHLFSVRMVFALMLDRFMCCVSPHNNLYKQSVPRFPNLYAIFLKLDTCILIFERTKGTEQKSN